MIDNQFSSKILTYLESQGKTLNQSLLEEASKRLTAAFKRQLMEDRENQPGKLRMSSGGQCVRKQWYAYKGEKGEDLSGRTINTFLTGDLLEVGLSVLGRLAGWQLMGKPDGEDEVALKDLPDIKGHPDDILFVPEENKYYLIEYKTMSEYSYRKFEKEGLDDAWGYQTQSSLYCEAMGIEEYILVAQCKNTGHICDRIYRKDDLSIGAAKGRWVVIKGSEDAPAREHSPEPEFKYNRSTKMYDPTGRLVLGIQCQYCSFKTQCYPEAVMELKGEKPIWLVPNPVAMEI
jgi:hypothetical protein